MFYSFQSNVGSLSLRSTRSLSLLGLHVSSSLCYHPFILGLPFALRAKLVFYSASDKLLQPPNVFYPKLKCARHWNTAVMCAAKLRLPFFSWSGSAKGHMFNQWVLPDLQSAVTCLSRSSCFTIPFLASLFWFELFTIHPGMTSFLVCKRPDIFITCPSLNLLLSIFPYLLSSNSQSLTISFPD